MSKGIHYRSVPLPLRRFGFGGHYRSMPPPTPFSLLFPFLFHLPVQGLFRGRGPPLPLLFLFPFFPLTALLGLFALARETLSQRSPALGQG